MKRKAVAFLFLPLIGLAVLAFPFLHPASYAHARQHSHVMAKQQPLSLQAGKRKASNLTYHGGPVMSGTMQVYAIFWEPTGSSVSPTYNSLITRYFGDAGSSPLCQNTAQYQDANGNRPSGAVLGGSWVDTTPYPSTTLQDRDVQNEVINAMKVKGWTADITHAFFVFTAKNENICADVNQCFFTSFCGYHSAFGTNTIYAVVPYAGTDLFHCGVPSSPNRDIDADSGINVSSHEQMEAATDPLGNGWYDASGGTSEIGDKCLGRFGRTSNRGDVTWNRETYMVQEEWDNARSTCVLSGP